MRRDLLLLADMIEACDRAIELAEGADPVQLGTDWRTASSLAWQSSVIGEAARQLSEPARERHPQIPWGKATGLRNLITHQYWRVDGDILHATALQDLPTLRAQLREALDDLS